MPREPAGASLPSPSWLNRREVTSCSCIENSLTEGALYRFRDPEDGAGDTEQMLTFLNNFWHAVCRVFQRPGRSNPLGDHGSSMAAGS